jgi:peroxiredoxin
MKRIIKFLFFTFSIFAAEVPGPGVRIPEFRLNDQNGVSQTFESIRGPKGAMLVFYRSADW